MKKLMVPAFEEFDIKLLCLKKLKNDLQNSSEDLPIIFNEMQIFTQIHY